MLIVCLVKQTYRYANGLLRNLDQPLVTCMNFLGLKIFTMVNVIEDNMIYEFQDFTS